METSLYDQLLQTAAALALGIAAGILYDVLRVIRRRLPIKLVTLICDFVFCVAAGCALFVLGLTIGGGRQRALTAILSVLGGVLYFLTLTRPCMYLLEGFADLLSLFVRLLSLPAAFLLKTMKNFALFSKKVFNYQRGWYIFRERRAISMSLARSNTQDGGSVVREKSGNRSKAARVRGNRGSGMDDNRPARRHYAGDNTPE